jgi:hypothetical protein
MTAKEELEIKLGRVRNLMDKGGYQGVLFGTQFNFSWLTGGGDNQIIHGTELGFVNLLVTSDDIYIITNNIEMPMDRGQCTEERSRVGGRGETCG